MRGNDVLKGTPDIMVTDSLTGNVLIKMLSSFTTGGSFESTGYGYGPGIGEGYDRLVLIISRASGAPLIRDALKFAAELVQGKVLEIAAEEYQAAKKAGLEDILKKYQQKPKEAAEEVTAPPKEVVTGAIQGIEIMDLEDGVRALWKQNIYAESGMGCTGPVILVSEANCEKAEAILKEAGFIS